MALINWAICGVCGWAAYPDLSRHRLPVADTHKPEARPDTTSKEGRDG